MKYDYLKYWRPIKFFIKKKYGLSEQTLEYLLFLYSEKYFMRSDVHEYNSLLSWDKKRFDNLLRDGWIEVLRETPQDRGKIYKLSRKASRMIGSLYNKLNGEDISVDQKNNPMFAKKVGYTEQVYKNYIHELNRKRKEKKFGANDGL